MIDSHERNRVVPILMNTSTLATVLYAIAIRYCGHEAHDWEPETIILELKDELGAEMPEVNHDKLLALMSAIGSNSFYVKPMAFLAVTRTLNGAIDPVNMEDPLLPAEMAWATLEVKLNDDASQQFGPDVAALVGEILSEDGFVKPPKALAFAKIPEQYKGSSYPADLRKEEVADTEHAQLVEEYIQEQSVLLFRQISALPWHTEETLAALSAELKK